MPHVRVATLEAVAQRVLARHLARGVGADVQVVSHLRAFAEQGVDILVKTPSGERRGIRVKADPYFGTDPGQIEDRSLAYYRRDTDCFALEAPASFPAGHPQWMFESHADELFYYFAAVANEPRELDALLERRDEVFFSELKVERDELVILPMAETRDWFVAHYSSYAPRPIAGEDGSAWHRLVPRGDVQRHVPGVRIVGPVFSAHQNR
jgi:hypothetical protein